MKPTQDRFYTILGIDPGKCNTAYSVIRFKLNPFRYKILKNGMIVNTVNDLTGVQVKEQFEQFISEISELKKRFRIDSVIAERFQTRGGQSMGTTIEVVTAMNTLLSIVGFNRFQYITAAQWKNQWNRQNNLKLFYECLPIPPHPIDATGIALYGISQEHDEVTCFSVLADIPKLIQQLLSSADLDEEGKYHGIAQAKSRRKTKRRTKSVSAKKATGKVRATRTKATRATRSTKAREKTVSPSGRSSVRQAR